MNERERVNEASVRLNANMRCPWRGCSGQLEEVSSMSTLMGVVELDENVITSIFKCASCERSVIRSWSWRAYPCDGTLT